MKCSVCHGDKGESGYLTGEWIKCRHCDGVGIEPCDDIKIIRRLLDEIANSGNCFKYEDDAIQAKKALYRISVKIG